MMFSWSDFKKIDDNKFIVLTNYFEQYALGITGVNLESKIYSPKDGWDTRLEAQEFIKRNGLRKRTIKGKDSPWGEVGRKVFEVYAIKKKDIEKKKYYGATTLYILVPDEEK